MKTSTAMSADEETIHISDELVTRLKNYMNDPVYKEAVENSSSYNERLVKERKLRLPFIDAQTGYAILNSENFNNLIKTCTGDCYIWSSKLDRMPGYHSAQLYSYPARRWRKKRRQYLLNDNYINAYSRNSAKEADQNCCESTLVGGSGNASSSSSSLQDSNNIINNNAVPALYVTSNTTSNTTIVQNGNCINMNSSNSNSALNDLYDDSKDSWLRYDDEGSDLPDAGEIDDPESDFDDYEEYSTRKKKTKRKEPQVKRKRVEYPDSEKPYQCELCGARYKTRPGLSYHYSHSHQETSNGTLSSGNGSIPDEESSFFTSNNHNSATKNSSQMGNNHSLKSSLSNHLSSLNSNDKKLKDSRRASPSNYCDFCLGDSNENKKTLEPEDLVSCSDCGRSAHPTCLQFTSNMIISTKKYRWQCIECKSCGLCGTSDNDDQLLFCDDCDRGYHMYCLKPPLTEPPEGSWSCHLCIEEYHQPTKKEEIK
ncbi:zinc finger protein DPF3-like protein [Sarcoptes scabiei]|uniref:Zinc finger protein DPF3-like protein n=1 Tax=Sarcoptes scabiei TaxID=52283 RepID=A0A132AM39_SARSC|nr:zinc finger protein DPF3-like protein [Sarcoptes scabiei]